MNTGFDHFNILDIVQFPFSFASISSVYFMTAFKKILEPIVFGAFLSPTTPTGYRSGLMVLPL